MTNISGDYEPSTTGWVRDQVDTITETGDTRSVGINGMEVVLLTMLGHRSGKVRKVPLMRVEHDGVYLAVGSKGGAPEDPAWVANLEAGPDIDLQDGTDTTQVRARRIDGDERAAWWPRAVEAFPPYAEYQERTDRTIPVFVLEPR
jgi:deazaflavin-dependent oxidoreductase (nitroreductase family)